MVEKPFTLSIKVLLKNEQGQYLLLRRSLRCKGNPGKWDFPGGKMDPGETLDDAIKREVAEETGLAITLTGVAGASQSERPNRVVAYLFLHAQAESGQIQLSEEHSEYAWVTRDELRTLDIAGQFRAFVGDFAASKTSETPPPE